jgi:hypothetical protein
MSLIVHLHPMLRMSANTTCVHYRSMSTVPRGDPAFRDQWNNMWTSLDGWRPEQFHVDAPQPPPTPPSTDDEKDEKEGDLD